MPTAVPSLNAEEVHVYSDPNSNSFRLTGIEGTYTASVYDINGKALFNKEIQADENISMGKCTKGMYIIRIITMNGTIEKKILKR